MMLILCIAVSHFGVYSAFFPLFRSSFSPGAAVNVFLCVSCSKQNKTTFINANIHVCKHWSSTWFNYTSMWSLFVPQSVCVCVFVCMFKCSHSCQTPEICGFGTWRCGPSKQNHLVCHVAAEALKTKTFVREEITQQQQSCDVILMLLLQNMVESNFTQVTI